MDSGEILTVDSENTGSRADGLDHLAVDLSLVPVGNERKGSRPGAPTNPFVVHVPRDKARTGNSRHAVQALALIHEGR